MSPTALILGTSGKIGRHSATAFAAAGWQVRRFDRVTQNMTEQAMGVDVIINGLNPPNYNNWAENIPRITHDVINAAKASGATVILPGNVCHFGNQGGTWSADTPPQPCSRKGQIRLDMERSYRDSGVQTIVLRAGNFMDPEGDECVLSLMYLRAIKANKLIMASPPHIRQAMCYVPDWAKAALTLSQQRNQLAQFEDIPFPGLTLTTAQIKTQLEQILDRPIKLQKFPRGLINLSAPKRDVAKELLEMRYLFETDHSLCDQRFKTLLPDFTPTPLAQALPNSLPMDLTSAAL